jgi:hypothetical protein
MGNDRDVLGPQAGPVGFSVGSVGQAGLPTMRRIEAGTPDNTTIHPMKTAINAAIA